MMSTSGCTRGPSRSSARPKSTENSSTCSTSPLANAADDRVGDDVEEEVDGAQMLRRCRVRRHRS